MATLSRHLHFALDGTDLKGGSLSSADTLTVDGRYVDLKKSVADGTTWDAWGHSSEDAIADFDYLFIESDKDVYLELTIDKGGEVGTRVVALEIKAGVPLDLMADEAMANYTADFATGTEDVIDRVRVRNVSGSAASVRLVLVT